MTTIEAQVPEPVLEQARALAEREGIPLEQIISLAVTQSVGVWSHESYLAHRAKHASREAFEQALAEVPDAPPLPGDEWPPLA
jgi:hypothetical protein